MTCQEHERLREANAMQLKFKLRIIRYALNNYNNPKWKRIVYLLSYGAPIKHVMLGI